VIVLFAALAVLLVALLLFGAACYIAGLAFAALFRSWTKRDSKSPALCGAFAVWRPPYKTPSKIDALSAFLRLL
jgi:hypothetical protein